MNYQFNKRPKHPFYPKKSWGQNFLRDKKTIDKIIETAKLPTKAQVLEIGAGRGALTKALTRKVSQGRILACEKDPSLADKLGSLERKFANLDVKIIDALKLLSTKRERLFHSPYYIVANIPYGITNPVVRFLSQEIGKKLQKAVLLLQREVADKLSAGVGSSARTAQTVFLKTKALVKIVGSVDRKKFYPPPQVDSAIVLIKPRPNPPALPAVFERVVKVAFAQKRKTLRNSLLAGLACSKSSLSAILREAKVQGGIRAQDLTISQFIRLSRATHKQLAFREENYQAREQTS